MKLYITGIVGLLGANIALELKEKYHIYGVDLVQIPEFALEYECYDLLNIETLEHNILKYQPDVIVHTAAMVNVDLCEQESETAKLLNSELTRQIARICGENNIKLIYISTDSVFDGEYDGLYTEQDMPNPVNIYAKTKLAGEQYAIENNGLVLRTNIYGINIQGKDSFGEWIVSSLEQGKELSMFEDIRFSPILVNDVARVIDLAIQNNLIGLYHVCGTGSISKYDFAVRVKEKFGITTGKITRSSSDCVKFKACRPHNMGMSNEKLCSILDIKIPTPEESIEKFLRLYYERRRKI